MTLTSLVEILLDTKSLKKALKGAHFPIPYEIYIEKDLIATLLSVLLCVIAYLVLVLLGIDINPISFLPQPISYVLVACAVALGIFLGIWYYPELVARGRKTRIDLDLPYAITYMEALSGTVNLYTLFRSVYEAEDLYGEVSRECGMIVRDVELFGEDLMSAMRHLQEYTPSENFSDLLNDLALVSRSGGNLTSFFDSRSASFRELAKQELESCLGLMEMMAEIYVTAFVAGPIAMIIMLVAQNISGHNQMQSLMLMMYIGLPIGAAIMIVILYILLPPDNLDISRSEQCNSEFSDEHILTDIREETDTDFIKKLDSRKNLLKIKENLKHPFKFYISDYQNGIVAGCILMAVLTLFWFNGMLVSVFPSFTFEVYICLLIILFMLPIMIAYEARKIYANNVEAQLPELLRDIADMKDVGMTLQSAITIISSSKVGVLSSELKIVSEDLKLGASTSNALVRMEERIGLVTVKRAISLVVRASEVTDQLREILTIAISDLEHYLKMKSQRMNVSFLYIAVIYLSIGIYLYSAYQLNVSFISSFNSFNINFDLNANQADMFHIAIILGTFSGLMAGQLSSNNLLSGFKHSIVFLVASIVLFVYII